MHTVALRILYWSRNLALRLLVSMGQRARRRRPCLDSATRSSALSRPARAHARPEAPVPSPASGAAGCAGRVLETQQFILGEPVAAFERAAAAQLGVAHALGCSSGTDALWLALAAAGIGPGEAVVTTPFSFFASVSAILRAGATAGAGGHRSGDFQSGPGSGGSRSGWSAGRGVRAVLPVHLYGQSADWTAFAPQRIGTGLQAD